MSHTASTGKASAAGSAPSSNAVDRALGALSLLGQLAEVWKLHGSAELLDSGSFRLAPDGSQGGERLHWHSVMHSAILWIQVELRSLLSHHRKILLTNAAGFAGSIFITSTYIRQSKTQIKSNLPSVTVVTISVSAGDLRRVLTTR